MARTGRFGRLPRAAPALGSVIASLAREMASQQDRNIVDAWREGGLVEGKKVTDEMLVEHFRKRRDAVDPADPLWDTYNTLLMNYEFAIADSKMTLKYANHEVNESQMATHYTEWANKLPVDSEAYRELMRSAAQFRDAANERGRAGAAASRATAFKNGEQAIKDAKMRPYDDATNLMTQAAIRYGILADNMTGEAPNLFQMRVSEGDQGRFLELFSVIQSDPRYADIRAGLAAAGINPSTFTYGTYLQMGQSYGQGLDQLVVNAQNFGESDWADKYQGDKASFTQSLLYMGDLDVQNAYNVARKDFVRVAQDITTSPYEQDAAMNRYQRILERLLGQTTSDAVSSGLSAELRALNGDTESVGPTPWEGAVVADPVEGDAATTAQQRNANNAAIKSVNEGRAVMVRGAVTSGGQPVPVWQAVPVSQDMADPTKGTIVWADMGAGKSAPRWVQYTPIISEGGRNIDPNTGVPTEWPVAVGSSVIGQTFMLNGKRQYGIYNDQHVLVWTPDNPFRPPPGSSAAVTYASDEDGYHVFWEVPAGAGQAPMAAQGGVTPGAGGGYSPKDIVPPALFDEDIPNNRRFSDPTAMVYSTDRRSAQAILRANPATAHALITTTYGDGLAGMRVWNDWQAERNRLAVIADQYVTPREIAMRGGDSLQQAFGVGAARVAPDRLGTGEERYATAASATRNQESIMRQRAAGMVTNALFVYRPPTRGGRPGQATEAESRRAFQARQMALAAGMTQDQLEAWVSKQTGQDVTFPQPGGAGIDVSGFPTGTGGFPNPLGGPRPPSLTTIKPPPTIAVPLAPAPVIKPPSVHPVDLGESIPPPPPSVPYQPPAGVDPKTGRPYRSGPQQY